jgi:uncharacterized protein (UPF0548 family)
MFTLFKPSEKEINDFARDQARLSFSYKEVGATKNDSAPEGYPVNYLRKDLGKGEKAYVKAVAALHSWRMYALGWTEVHPPRAPVREGEVFVTLVNHLGFWSLNPCRVVYTSGEETNELSRSVFAIGTLPAHSEKGEERFTVEWNKKTGAVTYEIYAFAKAHNWMAKIGFPFVPLFQKRFAADSCKAMLAAIDS